MIERKYGMIGEMDIQGNYFEEMVKKKKKRSGEKEVRNKMKCEGGKIKMAISVKKRSEE